MLELKQDGAFFAVPLSPSAKDCYPELAQNRNVFAARGGKGEFVVRSDAMPRWVVLRDFMLVLHQALG